jgi:hypothetical protein
VDEPGICSWKLENPIDVRFWADDGQPGSNAQDGLSTMLPEVGFVEVKSLFTFYPREHRSPVQSYGL